MLSHSSDLLLHIKLPMIGPHPEARVSALGPLLFNRYQTCGALVAALIEREIRQTYGDSAPEQETVGLYTIHTVCANDACLAYVVKQGFDDHILMVHGLGVTREDFTSLINGGLNADRE